MRPTRAAAHLRVQVQLAAEVQQLADLLQHVLPRQRDLLPRLRPRPPLAVPQQAVPRQPPRLPSLARRVGACLHQVWQGAVPLKVLLQLVLEHGQLGRPREAVREGQPLAHELLVVVADQHNRLQHHARVPATSAAHPADRILPVRRRPAVGAQQK